MTLFKGLQLPNFKKLYSNVKVITYKLCSFTCQIKSVNLYPFKNTNIKHLFE